MLKIKTTIGPSKTHGIGLFADQFIPKGMVTWQYDQDYDTSFSPEQIDSLSSINKIQFLKYGYYDYKLEKFILCSDDQRVINHSSHNYNVDSTPEKDVANRDIKPGEELLCNYESYEPGWFEKRHLNKESFN